MEVIETEPTTPTMKRKLEDDDSQNQSKKIKIGEDKQEVFSSPSNVVDVQVIAKSDNVIETDNHLNTDQSQTQTNIIPIPLFPSTASSLVKSTSSTPSPPPIKSTASAIPVIQETASLEMENLYLESIKNELPQLDVTKEEDQLYRQLMEECMRTIKAYTYVLEKHLSNATLKNAERDMNRAKKKYEKEKNRRIKLLEKSIKEKNKAQKEKERAMEKAEKEAKRLKAKADKEKKDKDEKTSSSTSEKTKEEKPKSNLPSITSFFTVKISSTNNNNNNSTNHNKDNNNNNNSGEVVNVKDDSKSVDLAYQKTVKYLELCNKKYDIETEFKHFLNKMKMQRKNNTNKKSVYHSKNNKLIQIIGTARNGNRIPTMSYFDEERVSKVIGPRRPLKCDPYVGYSFEDIEETDEDDDEEGEEDIEGEDLSQADSNEEEEEIELEEECKEEGKNVNELDYHDGFLDSEENDQVMHLMNKINTGQRVAVIIQPYFGEIDNIPKELLPLKLIKM